MSSTRDQVEEQNKKDGCLVFLLRRRENISANEPIPPYPRGSQFKDLTGGLKTQTHKHTNTHTQKSDPDPERGI